MITSLRKLRGFAMLKHDNHRDKRQRQPIAQWEEIDQAHKDMQDMRLSYDKLLSAAAATTNNIYEFSESLKEIGDYLLEKTALSNFDDEESVQVLLMLGKVQLELQRRADVYRSHISLTITVPSESLLSELRIVEEMKSQCEAKRLVYEEAFKKHKEKGKLKSTKLDSQNLQDASDDYDQEVNSLLFRVRSLKQGQCRSLLTQAARHHAAQLSFFKKAYLSLEAVEPYVKSVAKDHHIDYEFSGLEDDGDYDDDEYSEGNGDDTADAGSSDASELSFDNRQDHPRNVPGKPMEDVEQLRTGYNTFTFRKEVKAASQSEPLFSDRRSDPNYKPMEMRSSSSQKHALYALPTPPEAKSPTSAKSEAAVSKKDHASLSSLNSYYSSPLVKNKYEKLVTDGVVSGPLRLDTQSVLKGSKQSIQSRPLPPPLLNGFSPPQVDPSFTSDSNKVKRYSFSGPLTGKQWQHKPSVSSSGPTSVLHSGPLLHTPKGHPFSASKFPSHTSSSFLSAPKISELHELPRPPPHLALKRNSPQFDYSEPLRPRGTDLSTETNVVDSAAVATLPIPPFLSRSYRNYSIPIRGQVTEPMVGYISLPLALIPLSTIQPAAPTS